MTEASPELLDLESSARRYVEARRSRLASRAPTDWRTAWRELAELGWLGASVPESRGGYGGAREMAVIARELSAGLGSEPYVEASVVPLTFLSGVTAPSDHEDLLPRAMSGEVVVCAALGSDSDFPRPQVCCAENRHGRMLNGVAAHVLGGRAADFLLVPARGEQGNTIVMIVNCAIPGVRREFLPTIDGREIARVTFDDVLVPHGSVCSEDDDSTSSLQLAVDTGVVAQSAQMIGAMDRAFELTRSYLDARRQFGQALAGFQVLRHRLADMYAEMEQARALVSAAVAALSSKSTRYRAQLASASKVRAIRAARLVGAQAIQLHGAIGLTEEYEVGRCYKRLLALEKIWGDLEFHTRRFVTISAAGHSS